MLNTKTSHKCQLSPSWAIFGDKEPDLYVCRFPSDGLHWEYQHIKVEGGGYQGRTVGVLGAKLLALIHSLRLGVGGQAGAKTLGCQFSCPQPISLQTKKSLLNLITYQHPFHEWGEKQRLRVSCLRYSGGDMKSYQMKRRASWEWMFSWVDWAVNVESSFLTMCVFSGVWGRRRRRRRGSE